jgi:uncharacterized membrane protein YbhN (UPF0104 family)
MKKLLISAAVSLLTLGLIFQLVAQGTGQDAELWPLIRDVVPLLLGGYVFCQIAQTMLRSERYRLLLRGAGEPRIPSAGHSFLATLARNAMVDLLPARAGELGYLALMNRNYRVGADTCLGSMAISFLFDMIALAAVLALAIAAPWTRGQATWPLLAKGAVVLTVVCLAGLWGLLTLLPVHIIPFWTRIQVRIRRRWLRRAADFIDNTLAAIARVRSRRLLLGAFLLSLGVRVFKYAGLFLLFRGVTRVHLPSMAGADARQVMPALLAGEGAAALPLPTLMGFGAYEGGATVVWSLLGFPAATALLAVLALHIVSQTVDYTLGGAACVTIAWARRPTTPAASRRPAPRLRLVLTLVILGFLAGALLFAAYEWRAVRKRGRLTPPAQGMAVVAGAAETQALADLAARYRGRLVWSSNRHGNHDILLMEWPARKVRRLTRDPHTETYPRLSPDGQKVLFARSQAPWVSQRNGIAWDTWLIDLATGRERRIATNALFATWTADGQGAVFQRNDTAVILHTLADGREQVLCATGAGAIPAGATLQTPHYNIHNSTLAVTLRRARRVTVLLEGGARLREIGDGGTCQLGWATTNSLVFIGRGGRMKNVIWRHDLERGISEPWLDLPGAFSHEYFPRLSRDGRLLVFGASAGGHEHDTADYEIFAWEPGTPPERAVRLTFHTGNDCWPDVWVKGAIFKGQP